MHLPQALSSSRFLLMAQNLLDKPICYTQKIYVNKTICMVICPSTRFKSIILWPGMNHLVPRLFQNAFLWMSGLVPFWVLRHSFLFINRLLVIQLKTGGRGTLSAPFWCLCQKLSLSPLYFNKTLLHKSSEWPSLVSGPRLNLSPPEAKNPSVLSFSNNLSVSPTQWAWVWINSRSWWQTGRPGVLQSMGLQRARHNWMTELNWTESYSNQETVVFVKE